MATSRKQVTNRLYIAIFVNKSVLGPLLCKCICSHDLVQILSSSPERPRLWKVFLLKLRYTALPIIYIETYIRILGPRGANQETSPDQVTGK